ncbi:MAG: DegT/DnrJ/EryC1/StrS family aminotransferase [Candidatus Aminicenantes bacterium]|nr:DegT/DnrJ/EryC1/StrS family aminotransferase [Candidatus Aminicenantes bacterium]
MLKLARPYIYPKGIRDAVNVFKSGNLVQGKFVHEFEEGLKNYLGIKHAILLSSGTAALHLSLMAFDIKKGDEIIIPAFTYPAPANVVEISGAKPVFVDISPEDFCIDVSKIEEKITDRTKAIIVVHEFGQAAEISKIIKIADKHNLIVIEDAACALGTEFKGKKAGTFGNLGCFSFHPRKIITTGEGGVVASNNDELAARIRSLRNHGIAKKNSQYDFLLPGLNYRMTDFQAALGLSQLEKIEEITKRRIDIARFYDRELSSVEWITTPKRFPDREMVYQTYHILLDDKIDRDKLIMTLKKHGIETNLGAQALQCLTFYKKKYGFEEESFPNALRSYRSGLALPIYPQLTHKQLKRIVGSLQRSLDEFC